MKMRSFWLVFLLFGAACSQLPPAEQPPVDSGPLPVLQHRLPDVHWDGSSMLSGDVDCDGNSDAVIAGREGDVWHLAVVLGPGGERIEEITFPIGGDMQESLCGDHPTFHAEVLSYDPEEEAGDALEGFHTSDRCIGINVTSGGCDAHHIYWNHVRNRLDWWRL